MTSTTSGFKSNFFPVFKKTVKRTSVSCIIEIVLAVFVAAIALAISYTYSIADYYSYRTIMEIDLSYGGAIAAAVTAAFCVFVGFFDSPRLFNEIYKKQSCDVYFSLPVRRGEYYVAAYLWGALKCAVPPIITAAIYYAAAPFFGTRYIQITFTEISSALLMTVGVLCGVLAIYSAFIMCAVSAGRKLQYIFLSVICVICSSTAISGIISTLNSIWGLSLTGTTALSIDPLNNIVNTALNAAFGDFSCLFLISLAEAVGMFFAGLLIFKRRKAESAEVSVTGSIVPYIILAVLDCAAYMYIASSDLSTAVSLIGGPLCMLIVTMLFCAVLYKKTFTKKAAVTSVAVGAVLTVFMCAVLFPTYSSYVKKVPDASEVESVEISGGSSGEIYSSLILNVLNGYGVDILGLEDDAITVTDPDAVEDVVAMHSRIVEDEVIEKSQQSTSVFTLFTLIFNSDYTDSYYSDEYYNTYDCRITYTLKSGRTLTRTYSVVSFQIIDQYADFIRNDEVIRQISPYNLESDDILYTNVTNVSTYESDDYSEDESYYGQDLSVENYGTFVDAYLNELLSLESNSKNNKRLVSSISTSNFYYDYYDYSSTTAADITVWYIDPSASDEIKEKIRSMSQSEIKHYAEYGYDYEDEEHTEIYNAITTDVIYVYTSQTQAINALKSAGIKFPDTIK